MIKIKFTTNFNNLAFKIQMHEHYKPEVGEKININGATCVMLSVEERVTGKYDYHVVIDKDGKFEDLNFYLCSEGLLDYVNPKLRSKCLSTPTREKVGIGYLNFDNIREVYDSLDQDLKPYFWAHKIEKYNEIIDQDTQLVDVAITGLYDWMIASFGTTKLKDHASIIFELSVLNFISPVELFNILSNE